MKEKFREWNPYRKTKIKLDNILSVIDEFKGLGIEELTVRQIYYQLVGLGHIPHIPKEYGSVLRTIKNARYSGIIDWDTIVDHARVSHMYPSWDSTSDIIIAAAQQYRLHRWEHQEYYVELISEKDALLTILEPIANEWHIRFTPYRGYVSSSILYELSKRIIKARGEGKIVKLYYLGDHDPSGCDMRRDIKKRLTEFLKGSFVEVQRENIALTMEQIREYDLPSNLVDGDDTRNDWYKENFGDEKWEVDALRPDILRDLVGSAIKKCVDIATWNDTLKTEQEEKKELEEVAGELERRNTRNGNDISK